MVIKNINIFSIKILLITSEITKKLLTIHKKIICAIEKVV